MFATAIVWRQVPNEFALSPDLLLKISAYGEVPVSEL